jgi:hypothetical protein
VTLQGCLTFERLLVPADSSAPRRRLRRRTSSRRTRARLEHRSQPTRTRLRHAMPARFLPHVLPALYAAAPRISLPPQVCPLFLPRHSCSRCRGPMVTHEQVIIAPCLILIDTTSPRRRLGRGNSVIQRDAVLGAERSAQRFGTREVFCCASARRSVVGGCGWRREAASAWGGLLYVGYLRGLFFQKKP